MAGLPVVVSTVSWTVSDDDARGVLPDTVITFIEKFDEVVGVRGGAYPELVHGDGMA